MTQIISTKTLISASKVEKNKRVNGFIFVMTMWLISRIVIVIAMQALAPLSHLPQPFYSEPLPLNLVPGFVPQSSWELFAHWDGAWYRQIATQGYEYVNDGKYHSVAFFPVFPLLARALMTFGLSFEVAGSLISNLAMLGALLLLYFWAEERHGVKVARWSTAVLAWCPYSLFGSLTYTEGLFLLFSTAALRSWEKGHYASAAILGAITTATRVTGIALLPTFLLIAWKERRPPIAYIAAIATIGGLLLFSLYCGIQFGDPLAFVRVQRAW
jgi:Gpi18-like mannosyltransferase